MKIETNIDGQYYMYGDFCKFVPSFIFSLHQHVTSCTVGTSYATCVCSCYRKSKEPPKPDKQQLNYTVCAVKSREVFTGV